MTRPDADSTASIPDHAGWLVAGGTSAATTGPPRDPGFDTAEAGAPGDRDDPFNAALAAALAPGLVLERELHGGAMARVFVAREVALDRRVVVKVLPPTLAAGINRDRFRLEIQLAAQLQHPHIVPLLAAGEVRAATAEATTADAATAHPATAAVGTLYYTMPFIEGESLRAELAARQARHAPFTWREVLRIFRDVAEALGHAHARGVVHRDVKPGNVLRLHGHALVTDFGVAKALASALPTAPLGTMTTLGVAIGTPAYMAPEQLAADPAADHRMDLYAAGLVAYELLSGESPFAAASPQATLAAQLTRVPADIAGLRPDIPRAFAAAVMHCLAKDPAERPATAEALLATLDTVGEVSSGPAPGAAAGPPSAMRPAPPRARVRQTSAAVALTISVAGAAWFARGHTSAASPASAVSVARASLARVPNAPAATIAPTPTRPAGAGPIDTIRPTLSRADSAAIAAAVAREFQRAAVRHGTPVTRGEPSATARAGPTAFGDTSAFRQLARAAVAESLVSLGDRWSRYSPDMVRALVGRMPIDVPRLPHGGGGDDFDHGRRRFTDDTAPFGRSPFRARVGGFAGIAAGLPPRAAGTRRVVLVMLSDGTGQRALAPVAPLVEAALRTQLRTLGAYELTDQGFGAVIRHEHVPDREVARAADATAVLRGTITASADRVRAVLLVYDARRGVPAVVQADAPLSGDRTAPAVATALASPLARAVATLLDGMTDGRAPGAEPASDQPGAAARRPG